ncbi:MAG: CAP domain-containing protein [Hyphomicrobiales bacterium]
MKFDVRKAGIPFFVMLLLLLIPGGSGAAADYRDYAIALVKRPPAGAELRLDLEAYLDRLADAYRREKDQGGLFADDLMRVAARAQALDMMLAGRSGHVSRTGVSFDGRFGAFVENVDLFPARGENAASDRSRKQVDESKARHLFELWLQSSEHRRNLAKRDYAFVSTGVVQRGSELWAVQIFWARPIPPNPLIQ